jgi:hypothetical protein
MRLVPLLACFAACHGQASLTTKDGTSGTTDGTPTTDTHTTDTQTTPTDGTVPTDTGGSSTSGGRIFDDQHVLVVPDSSGLQLLANDGTSVFFQTWSQLLGGCGGCGGEGSSDDGDGLLVSFTTSGGFGGSGVARIDADGNLDWRVDGFAFAHDAIRDPADDSVLVPEAFNDSVTWIAGDGSSGDPIRAIDGNDAGWEGDQPNGADKVLFDGGVYVLESHRGAPTNPGASGEISFWDISDPAHQTLMWRFPGSNGNLHTPHGCIFRYWNQQWWLIWAHSDGLTNGSSVGLAVTDDPTVMPEYVADLVPTGPDAPFDFLRGVELTDDGWLWLTDSGGFGGFGGGSTGRVFKAPMPTGLQPSGESGDSSNGQTLVDLTGLELMRDGLGNPFEGWLWKPPS